MELSHLSFTGPQFEADSPVIELLPPNLVAMLRQMNGFIQYAGGLHVRGVCSAPDWHSLEHVMLGERALHRLYPAVEPSDAPFAQDCVADQFLLRDGIVHRLRSETGEVESLEVSLQGFIAAVDAEPIEYLGMQPLLQYQQEGGMLEPGQVLHVYPPFCTKEAETGVSLKAVGAQEALAFLADFSSKMAGLADGERLEIGIGP